VAKDPPEKKATKKVAPPAKKTVAKKAPAKKVPAKKVPAKKVPAKKATLAQPPQEDTAATLVEAVELDVPVVVTDTPDPSSHDVASGWRRPKPLPVPWKTKPRR
jgi:hypothetical protein